MAQAKAERRGLGRGLSALMADVDVAPDRSGGAQAKKAEASVAIDKVFPNPDQPRRSFAEAALNELAASISAKGIIQPLVVRARHGSSGEYEIIAGERRWRAAQRAQLHEVPIVVRDLNDTEVLEVAIVENIQRADLNAVEEAAGYQQLMDRFGHTQEKVAEALGKSRSHIANLLRLLTLPEAVQIMIRDGQLSAGHARALVTADDPVALANEVVRRGLSVRETEKLVKSPKIRKATNTNIAPEKDADTKVLEKDLTAALGAKVTITHDAVSGKGIVKLDYKSLDQLDEICKRLSVTTGAGKVNV